MNPWLLREVRQDDVAARYREADHSRLAALAGSDSAADRASGKRPGLITGVQRAADWTAVRWVAGIALAGTLAAAAMALVR